MKLTATMMVFIVLMAVVIGILGLLFTKQPVPSELYAFAGTCLGYIIPNDASKGTVINDTPH